MRPVELPIRGCHPLWLCFPAHSGHSYGSAGPRSLAATEGVSVDFLSSGYLDVSVPRVRSYNPMYSDYKYLFQQAMNCLRNHDELSGGFPHSEIHGSKLILSSPWLIAEYHVLHRLLLPRHPPNALIALDLIRKKKDPHHCSVLRGTWRPREASSVKACIIYSRLPHSEKTWLVYLTWTTPPFVPKNNRTPTRVRPTTLIISLNDVNATKRPRRPTGRESTGCFPIQSAILVEPDGFEPTTSCLQSRRSTN